MKFTSFYTILGLLLGVIVLQSIFYFGFDSAYLSYKNLNDLPEFYHSNIFKYRLFSTELFERFYHQFKAYWLSLSPDNILRNNSDNLGSPMYLSLFLYNTIFFILFALIWVNTLSLTNFSAMSEKSKLAISILVFLLIAISQYVLTPYDMSGLFLQIIGVWLCIQLINSGKMLYLLLFSLLMIIATLNRESAAINLSFLAALAVYKYGWNPKSLVSISKIIILPTLAFVLTYVGLRVYFHQAEFLQGNYVLQNLSAPKNILGIIFFVLCLRIGRMYGENNTLSRWFLLFALPYIGIIFWGGILWEIRLFVPVLVPFFLSRFIQVKRVSDV